MKETDGSGRVVEVTRKMPVWLRPHSGAQTPMCGALGFAAQAVEAWIKSHPDSFPPIIINISDGEATDGDPLPVAEHIRGLKTTDGNVLLFNCHLSDKSTVPLQYPDGDSNLREEHARQMFRMSSVMPPASREHAALLGIPVRENSRCCVFNADMVSLVQFLDIGTRGPSGLH